MKKVFLLIVVYLLLSDFTSAIPAFARKYNMTCKTCHSPFPVLKEYGEEFAANGFVLRDHDAPRYFVETGDNELSLIRDLPLALRLEGFITYNTFNSEKADFAAPYLLKLLSGGSITKNISYYFYFFFGERGEVAGVEDAFIMFNNLFESELDVYVGQFQVSDPLFKRELRLTLDDYQIYRAKPGKSNINLTYDRGFMFTYGLPTNTDITFEILNGNGIGAASSSRIFDDDKNKSFMARISQGVAGPLRLGGFAYYGKENNGNVNELWMAGGDLTVDFAPLTMNLQYVHRKDNNPFFLTSAAEVETKGAIAELIIRPQGDESKIYSVVLFNWIESMQESLNLKSLAFHLGYVLKRNFRIAGEYSHNFSAEYGTASIGLITAF